MFISISIPRPMNRKMDLISPVLGWLIRFLPFLGAVERIYEVLMSKLFRTPDSLPISSLRLWHFYPLVMV